MKVLNQWMLGWILLGLQDMRQLLFQKSLEDDNVVMVPDQGKTLISILNDDHYEELVFPYLFPTGKFGYKVKREVPLSPVKYFNQGLLNFRQSFASDADYIFFTRSIAEQHHLRSSINILLLKVQGRQLTAGSVRQNYKESVKRLSSTPTYCKQFLYEVQCEAIGNINIFFKIVMV